MHYVFKQLRNKFGSFKWNYVAGSIRHHFKESSLYFENLCLTNSSHTENSCPIFQPPPPHPCQKKRSTFDHPKIRWFLGVADTNDVIKKIEKTLNNTHTTTQKLTNNSFRNTKKHPKILIILFYILD